MCIVEGLLSLWHKCLVFFGMHITKLIVKDEKYYYKCLDCDREYYFCERKDLIKRIDLYE